MIQFSVVSVLVLQQRPPCQISSQRTVHKSTIFTLVGKTEVYSRGSKSSLQSHHEVAALKEGWFLAHSRCSINIDGIVCASLPIFLSLEYSFCSFDTLVKGSLREKIPWRIDATIVVSCPPRRCRLCTCSRWCHGHQLTWMRALRDLTEGPLLIIVCMSSVPRSITAWALCFRVSKSRFVFWNLSSVSSEHVYPY